MSQSRQLAAIMFTDIVGYTALMEEDEQLAFELLKKNRSVQRPIVEKHHGKWLKEIGDGVLASFSTISDAVYAAGEIQKRCENESDLKLRIGIHVGEVRVEGEDIFGSGVNIASRLEPLAPVGGILVSGAVYKNIHNKKGINTTFIGEKELKGVREPVKIYQVKIDDKAFINREEEILEQAGSGSSRLKTENSIAYSIGLVVLVLISYLVYNGLGKSGSPDSSDLQPLDKSIVVLPFDNISNDPNQEYFVVGMMEEIINHLVKINDLKVVPRSTAMTYQGSTKTNKQIAEELGVATILQGGVRKDGSRLRISVQLINGATDEHIWSESYERNLIDVFAIQSDVAQNIVSSLQAEIQPEVQLRIESQPTTDLDAYDYYLRGNESYWSSWAKFEVQKIYESIEYYEKAIEIDENFSLGFTGLGRSYWWLAHLAKTRLEREVSWEKSKKYLEKAISIDPYNGWAYSELVVVASNWLWDSTATRNYMDMALKLSPNDANVHIHSFFHEFRFGKCEKLSSIKQRLEDITTWAGLEYSIQNLTVLLCQKDYQQIISIAENLDLAKDVGANRAWIIYLVYLYQNRVSEAREVLNHMNNNIDIKSFEYLNEGLFAAQTNNIDITNQMIDSLDLLSNHEIVPYTYYAVIYAVIKDQEAMYDYLNKALSVREKEIHDFNFYPWFNSYKHEPRFKEIIAKMWVPLDLEL